MLLDEYNAFYRSNPNKWESVAHDEFVYKTVASYGPALNLLDVGCGNGHTLRYFSERWQKTKCVGVDLSDVVIKYAKSRFPHIRFVCAQWEETDLEYFDMILVVGVAEHFTDPLVGLSRVKDALDDDGIVYFEVPNCLGFQATVDKSEGFRRLELGSRQMEWHLKRETWEHMIDAAGLKIRQSLTGPNTAHEFVWILE